MKSGLDAKLLFLQVDMLIVLFHSFRVEKHMSVDNDYEFRVIALNKGGESEASPVSNTIHAMIRFIKPKINRDVFPTEKTIHASQTLK